MIGNYTISLDPTCREIERAVLGLTPRVVCLPQVGLRPQIWIGELGQADWEAFELAKLTGYVVHRGSRPPWPVWDAWWAWCRATGKPAIRVWAFGERFSRIRLDLETVGPRAGLSETAFEELWELVCKHSGGVVQGGWQFLSANRVATARVVEIAARMGAVAGGWR